MRIEPIPAFRDNYIWSISRDARTVVVDPGDSLAVVRHLEATGHALAAILVTHHHQDHVGGVLDLVRRYSCPVYGPATESTGTDHIRLAEGDSVEFKELGLALRVLDIPGHTLGHIAFVNDDLAFCGDTLFAGGCGRLFEGTPEQMYASLQKLASLPDETDLYCAHEYTESNLVFALAVEPDNPLLQHRLEAVRELRRRGACTLPTTVALEKATNPFLRTDTPAVREAAQSYLGRPPESPIATFAAIRRMKDAA
jgi:hydroxyacylglutathione hydrolase